MNGVRENAFRITVGEVLALRAKGEPVAFIDARNPIAWGSSKVKIQGAYRVPVDDVERHLPSLPPDNHLVVYCT